MSRFRFIMQSSKSCMRRWKSAPRILILFGFIACITIIYAMPFVENAKAQGEALQCTELFTALMDWRFTMLVFSSVILLLFGDLPVIQPFTLNALIRGTRRSWMASQVFYVFVTSAILCAFIFLITVFIALPNLDFSNQWSRPVKLMSHSGRFAIPPERMTLIMPSEIVMTYSPWVAFGHSIALFFMMSMVYGLGSLVLKMRFPSGGLVFLLIANVLSWSTGMFYAASVGFSIVSMLSLHYHASLSHHFMHSMNALAPSLGASYAFFVIGICILVSLSMTLVKHFDFVRLEDEPS